MTTFAKRKKILPVPNQVHHDLESFIWVIFYAVCQNRLRIFKATRDELKQLDPKSEDAAIASRHYDSVLRSMNEIFGNNSGIMASRAVVFIATKRYTRHVEPGPLKNLLINLVSLLTKQNTGWVPISYAPIIKSFDDALEEIAASQAVRKPIILDFNLSYTTVYIYMPFLFAAHFVVGPVSKWDVDFFPN